MNLRAHDNEEKDAPSRESSSKDGKNENSEETKSRPIRALASKGVSLSPSSVIGVCEMTAHDCLQVCSVLVAAAHGEARRRLGGGTESGDDLLVSRVSD